MKTFIPSIKVAAALLLALAASTGCESTDGGGSTHSTVYYGSGWYGDPYYHGDHDYDYDYDINVTPPPRPGRPDMGRPDGGPHPSHPIARPPSSGVSPRPSPMPSIPSTPRPSPRMGGGGGKRR